MSGILANSIGLAFEFSSILIFIVFLLELVLFDARVGSFRLVEDGIFVFYSILLNALALLFIDSLSNLVLSGLLLLTRLFTFFVVEGILILLILAFRLALAFYYFCSYSVFYFFILSAKFVATFLAIFLIYSFLLL